MRLKNSNIKAFTLIELIVSLMLVSIVLLGIFAISNVLTSNNLDYGQKNIVNVETQATLQNILNNAFLAIGDNTVVGGAPANPPVLIGGGFCNHFNTEFNCGMGLGGAHNPTSFCIHQEPDCLDLMLNLILEWLCCPLQYNYKVCFLP